MKGTTVNTTIVKATAKKLDSGVYETQHEYHGEALDVINGAVVLIVGLIKRLNDEEENVDVGNMVFEKAARKLGYSLRLKWLEEKSEECSDK